MQRSSWISSMVGVVAVAAGCTSGSGSAALTPLSADCEACLAGGTDGGVGCGLELDACTADATCNDAALCELRAHCYETPVGSSCSSDAGCRITADAATAEAARAAFESCARTRCSVPCAFVHP